MSLSVTDTGHSEVMGNHHWGEHEASIWLDPIPTQSLLKGHIPAFPTVFPVLSLVSPVQVSGFGSLIWLLTLDFQHRQQEES